MNSLLKLNKKTFLIILSTLVATSCATNSYENQTEQVQSKLHLESKYFDLSDTDIPESHYEIIRTGILKAEEVLNDVEFLQLIESKNDWRYPPSNTSAISGSQVVEIINTGEHVITSDQVKPKIFFYTPPKWGKDICGGISLGFFKRTRSTGCTLRGDVYKNLLAVGGSWDVFSEFVVHEWLHAAGFSHGGNSNQCKVEKRNSVPIYVGCVAQNFALNQDVLQCREAC